jgi:diaminopimelate decarboxylase
VPSIIAAVCARGFGANVVSRGEWALARRAGIPNERITLEGVGKTPADLRAAARAAAAGDPLLWVALESPEEAEALAAAARRAGAPPIDVLYRLNPDVAPETIASLAVGAGATKFGMTETEIATAISAGGGPDGPLRPRGIHLHVGSQLGAVDAWREAVRKALAVAVLWQGSIDTFDTVDLGGGFPVLPEGQPAPTPERFARELPALLDGVPGERRPSRLSIEPGRALVARAGWLVGRVLHVRERGGRQVVIDTGMTELIRPALYGAIHPIVALTSLGRVVEPGVRTRADVAPTAVEGPICESTDSLGVHDLPPLRRGDLVAIGDVGAYAASLSSRYNGRPRIPQVLV